MSFKDGGVEVVNVNVLSFVPHICSRKPLWQMTSLEDLIPQKQMLGAMKFCIEVNHNEFYEI